MLLLPPPLDLLRQPPPASVCSNKFEFEQCFDGILVARSTTYCNRMAFEFCYGSGTETLLTGTTWDWMTGAHRHIPNGFDYLGLTDQWKLRKPHPLSVDWATVRPRKHWLAVRSARFGKTAGDYERLQDAWFADKWAIQRQYHGEVDNLVVRISHRPRARESTLGWTDGLSAIPTARSCRSFDRKWSKMLTPYIRGQRECFIVGRSEDGVALVDRATSEPIPEPVPFYCLFYVPEKGAAPWRPPIRRLSVRT